MIYNFLRASALLLFLFLLNIPIQAEPTPEAGKTLFRNYCATCHSKNMKSQSTGPALIGYDERWADYSQEDLYAWIRNSQALISAGHPRAVELWNEYKPTVMQAFPNLTDEDITSLLLYIDGTIDGTFGPAAVAGTDGAVEVKREIPKYLYWLLLAALGVMALVLSRIITNLNRINEAGDGRYVERKTLLESLTSKGVVTFLIFTLVVLGGYTTVNNAVNLGRQQGYAPDQPIQFSHETHAGVHKIECQYCHDGARRSKHAVIPAANTCMNCHKAINVGSEFGTQEITKIFASIGYDPNGAGRYLDNYESLPQDSIVEIYKKWIGDQYMQAEGITTLNEEGQSLVDEQWNNIVSSLTNEQKKDFRGPIEWTRIHNLPDHAFFNHAQHVSVGEVECQTCHGKVEEMEVMAQYAPLSMGWCINCHRETEVQFQGNEYYASYAKYHEELAEGKREKVTVEDIGGLECQKCHY